MAAYTPVSHSPIWPPTYTGARRARPAEPTIPPDHACSVNSVAAGPPGPAQSERRDRGHDQMRVTRRSSAEYQPGRLGHTLSPVTTPPRRPVSSLRVDGSRSPRAIRVDDHAALRTARRNREGRAGPSTGIPVAPDDDQPRSESPRAVRLSLPRAAVCEQLRAVGAGDVGRQVDDGVAGQRAVQMWGRSDMASFSCSFCSLLCFFRASWAFQPCSRTATPAGTWRPLSFTASFKPPRSMASPSNRSPGSCRAPPPTRSKTPAAGCPCTRPGTAS